MIAAFFDKGNSTCQTNNGIIWTELKLAKLEEKTVICNALISLISAQRTNLSANAGFITQYWQIILHQNSTNDLVIPASHNNQFTIMCSNFLMQFEHRLPVLLVLQVLRWLAHSCFTAYVTCEHETKQQQYNTEHNKKTPRPDSNESIS